MHRLHVRQLRTMLQEAGLPVMPTESHILPLIIGDATLCRQLTDDLMQEFNIYCQPINYPTVAVGTERLRLTPGPLHSPQMLEDLCSALCILWDRHGLPRSNHFSFDNNGSFTVKSASASDAVSGDSRSLFQVGAAA